ncbi:hypothetical protein A3Q56_07857 [Intoshia linei]|uniref:Centrosomal protein of 19 kDa n=1 Tax=Intoshia linei TaxID=1819745 RepID=A0A177AR05_9BILA|nr:hypothetical protein A3Q56_07857 [Intoshia linei]
MKELSIISNKCGISLNPACLYLNYCYKKNDKKVYRIRKWEIEKLMIKYNWKNEEKLTKIFKKKYKSLFSPFSDSQLCRIFKKLIELYENSNSNVCLSQVLKNANYLDIDDIQNDDIQTFEQYERDSLNEENLSKFNENIKNEITQLMENVDMVKSESCQSLSKISDESIPENINICQDILDDFYIQDESNLFTTKNEPVPQLSNEIEMHKITKDDPKYVYDKQVEFNATDPCDWDVD